MGDWDGPSAPSPAWAMGNDLYTKFFERAVFPSLDRLNRTSISEKLKILLSVERDDPADIRARQVEYLDRTMNYTRDNSAFYRNFWRTAPEKGPRSNYPALNHVPVVTKSHFNGAGDEFPLSSYSGKVITCLTSGSTGSAMAFHRSAEQDSWFWALRFRIWAWAGYRPGDPYLTINLNPRTALLKRLQDLLFRCSYLTFNADNQDSARIVDELNRRSIENLNGFSSSLYVLARYMLQNDIRVPSVTGITATGDCLYPPYRETIEEAFSRRVLDYYGAGGEGVHLASQCEESGSRFHLFPENAIVEILDDEGPVAPGELGRVVVTQLHNDAMPLVRYELGDVAVPAEETQTCTCGRTLPMIERIEGRVPDLIVLRDGTFLVMHFFVVLFKNLQDVLHYQVVQDDVDSILVRIVGRPSHDRNAIEATVTKAVENAARGMLRVDFEWPDEIPLIGRGKRRLIISKVGREVLSDGRANS